MDTKEKEESIISRLLEMDFLVWENENHEYKSRYGKYAIVLYIYAGSPPSLTISGVPFYSERIRKLAEQVLEQIKNKNSASRVSRIYEIHRDFCLGGSFMD